MLYTMSLLCGCRACEISVVFNYSMSLLPGVFFPAAFVVCMCACACIFPVSSSEVFPCCCVRVCDCYRRRCIDTELGRLSQIKQVTECISKVQIEQETVPACSVQISQHTTNIGHMAGSINIFNLCRQYRCVCT